jgi:hypothetical protein
LYNDFAAGKGRTMLRAEGTAKTGSDVSVYRIAIIVDNSGAW